MDPAPFLRGVAFPPTRSVAYPRARPGDRRIPGDTWARATIPVGVRLELTGDAQALDITYETLTSDTEWQGDAGRSFESWSESACIASAPVTVAAGTVRVPLAPGGARTIVYLPERMRPRITDVAAVGGSIEPAPAIPRWIAYGDSIAEGWCASKPSLAWPAIAARAQGLDVTNLGYAGSARGELQVAEGIAGLDADVISLSYGTNCWLGVPCTPEYFAANLDAFLSVLRDAHPTTPVVVVSMVLRPQAEVGRNRVGATIADLRDAMEGTVAELIGEGDTNLRLVAGLPLVSEEMLADGVHPDDTGHHAMADAIGPVVAEAVRR